MGVAFPPGHVTEKAAQRSLQLGTHPLSKPAYRRIRKISAWHTWNAPQGRTGHAELRRKLLPALAVAVEIDSKHLVGTPRSCFISHGKPFGISPTLHQLPLEFGQFLRLTLRRQPRTEVFKSSKRLLELPGTTKHKCARKRPVQLRETRFCAGQAVQGELWQVPQRSDAHPFTIESFCPHSSRNGLRDQVVGGAKLA